MADDTDMCFCIGIARCVSGRLERATSSVGETDERHVGNLGREVGEDGTRSPRTSTSPGEDGHFSTGVGHQSGKEQVLLGQLERRSITQRVASLLSKGTIIVTLSVMLSAATLPTSQSTEGKGGRSLALSLSCCGTQTLVFHLV